MSHETKSLMAVTDLEIDWDIFDNWDAARRKYESFNEYDRKKLVTVLSAFKPAKEIALNLNIARHYIFLSIHEFPELAQIAANLRRTSILDDTYRRVFECIESIDVGELKEIEKTKVARDLLFIAQELSGEKGGGSPKESTEDVMKRITAKTKEIESHAIQTQRECSL